MVQWEYQTLEGPPDPKAIYAVCEKAGLDGWELCNALVMVKDFTGGMVLKGVSVPPPQPVAVFIFKRPLEFESSDEAAGTESGVESEMPAV